MGDNAEMACAGAKSTGVSRSWNGYILTVVNEEYNV